MKRFTINTSIVVIFGLGIALALSWAWGGGRAPAVAASRADGYVEAPNAPAAEGSTELAEVLHVCFGGCLYSSIQDAVDAANDGDVIKVAAGTYTDVNNRGGLAQVVYISKTVTIRGGYTIDNWTTSDPVNNPTTLDAGGQGRVLYITGDISPTVEGLRITGGDAAGQGGGPESWADAGGGVYVITATTTMKDNWVLSNTTPYQGGGLYLQGSDATLSKNIVSSNTAFEGGGLWLWDSNVTLSGGTVSANTASYHGGGLWLVESNVALMGSAITSNTASSGGGLNLNSSSATLSENTISSNTAGESGGGLYLWNSDATLTNSVVADNQTNTAGGGLYIQGSSLRLLHTTIARNTGGDGSGVHVTEMYGAYSSAALTDTILVGHTVGITVAPGNTARLEGTLWGSGAWANTTDWGGDGTVIAGTVNIWGNPSFVDPDNGDYHIGVGSAAIDTGVDAGVTTDIDGDPRPASAGFDIGADEYFPALEVVKGAYPDPVRPGAPLTYTVHITNVGSVDLHATITDTLPFSVTLDKTSGGTLALPGRTVILPDGRVAVTWTAVITAPGGLWTGTILVTVDWGYPGWLTNLVEVMTEEGATGTYTHFTKPTPGLIIQGHVWRNHEGGLGLANVAIYRRFASYPGQLVATTDQDGYYQSDFVYIPGDEMVTVWAELGGYTFRPPMYYWRHYYGHEVATLDFVANPKVYLPLILKQ